MFFHPSGIGNTPNSHKLEAHSKLKYSVYIRGPRCTANAQRFFYWWAKCRCMHVPSKVCCGKVAQKRARLRVGACTDRLLSPCHHPPVSCLLPRICLVGRTMAPSQLLAAPTPRRCDGSKDKKTKQTSVLDLPFENDMAVIFSVHKAARRPAKKSQN